MNLSVSTHQQWAVTIALELEQVGHTEAADYLRHKHFPTLPWKQATRPVTNEGFEAMLRVHHGSLPPVKVDR